ncbi:TIGR02594 family protein [Tenacibaculum sp. MAR_2009_124]|uniref:TIGR02594 family protein n=1 Tax=Tenacibaculum sp. MAR_2009_124 TaxID=1250059 RepID=UPI0008973594|nr:TIGR02594 family protein [Tenacibaculum sp. MAR_2009_124]SEC46765.1 TIGR02594 family protein [Tenacibaculum sp. MAR_2009_124]
MSKTLKIALSQYGIREIKGIKHNPEVLKYFKVLGYEDSRVTDETAWCSAFANWVCMKAQADYSGKLTARSWLKIGKRTQTPKQGDIVVLWRESKNSWKGHVGFFIKQTDNYIYVLGGNQKDQVNIQAYPKSRLLEFRKVI